MSELSVTQALAWRRRIGGGHRGGRAEDQRGCNRGRGNRRPDVTHEYYSLCSRIYRTARPKGSTGPILIEAQLVALTSVNSSRFLYCCFRNAWARSSIRSSGSSSPMCSRTRFGAGGCGHGPHRVDRQRQAFVAAPAVADAEQLEAVDEGGARRVVGALELEREQARRALEVALPRFVARGSRAGPGGAPARPRGCSLSHCATLSALASCCFRRTAMVRSPREPSQASSGETAVAEIPRRASGCGRKCSAVAVDGAEHHVGMPADIFGRGEDADVDPGRDRREEQRRRPGVVEQGDDPALAGPARRSPGTSWTSMVSEPGLSSRIARVCSPIGSAMPRRSAGRNSASRRRSA